MARVFGVGQIQLAWNTSEEAIRPQARDSSFTGDRRIEIERLPRAEEERWRGPEMTIGPLL